MRLGYLLLFGLWVATPVLADTAQHCAELARPVQTAGTGVYWRELDAPMAIEVCAQAIAENPGDHASHAYLARAFFKAGQKEAGVQLLLAIESTQDPDALAYLARVRMEGDHKDPGRALIHAQRSAELGNRYGMMRLFWLLNSKGSELYDPEQAQHWLERAVEAGSPYAFYERGRDRMYRDGADENAKRLAVKDLRVAAESGHSDAMVELGRAYRWGYGVEIDLDQAIAWWVPASDAGEAFASKQLARMHWQGLGTKVDIERAESLYLRSVEQGSRTAYFSLYVMLEKSAPDRSFQYLKAAADLRDPKAVFFLGLEHVLGNRVPQNYERGAELYLQAYELGYKDAGWRAANLLLEHFPERHAKAIALLREGADAGDAASIQQLGKAYEKGLGVPKDTAEAARYYQMAHRLGDLWATSSLAGLLLGGVGSYQDAALAAQLWESASASKDNNNSFLELGLRYRDGEGVPQDRSRAIALLQKGVNAGGQASRLHLADMLLEADADSFAPQEAARLFQVVADTGSPVQRGVALSRLGGLYETATGVARDIDRARDLYAKATGLEITAADYQDDSYALTAFSTAFIRSAALLIEEGGPENLSQAALHLTRAVEGGSAQAWARLEQAFSDAEDPLYEAFAAPDESLSRRLVALGRFFEEARLSCGYILSDCGRSGQQRLSLTEAAKWYRRGGTDPTARFRLGRLLRAHPDLADNPEEAGDALRDAAQSGLPGARIMLGLDEAAGLDVFAQNAIFSDALDGLPTRRAAWLAAMATIGRFGDDGMGPGWRWLQAQAETGVAEASLGLFATAMFFGAFEQAAGYLDEIPPQIDLDLTDVDYSLRQSLRYLMNNVRDGVTPSETQLAQIEALLNALESRAPEQVGDLQLMLQEVRYRLRTRDDFVPLDLPIEVSLEERIGKLIARIGEKSELAGLSPILVQLYQSRAILEAEAGDAAAAERSVYASISVAREMNDATRHLVGSLTYHMEMACWLRKGSDILFSVGANAAGLTLAKSAVNELQSARARLVGLPENLQDCFRDLLSTQYRQMADLLIREGHLDEAQWVLGQLKDFESYQYTGRTPERAGQSFDPLPLTRSETDIMARIHGLPLAELRQLSGQVRSLEERGKDGEADKLRNRLETARAALSDSLDALADDVASQDKIGQRDFADAISARSLRRLGGRLDRLDGIAMVYSVTLPERTHFLIVTGDGTEHRSLDLGEADLNARITALRGAMTDPNSDPRPIAQAFYRDVWQEVDLALGDARIDTALLSLDGLMRYVPILALHDGQDWLVHGRSYVTFTSASRDLLLDNETLDNISVEALGATRGGQGFSALPNVGREIRAIVGHGGGGGLVKGRSWLDNEFDAAALATAFGSGAPVVHLATHFHLSEREETSALLLGSGDIMSVAALKDGIRRGHYDLADIQMLVLSACQTAVVRGSELESLAAEMQWEGVRTVVATLWPVEDRSTADFMAGFYGKLAVSQSRASALRQMQTEFSASEKQGQAGVSRGGKTLAARSQPALPGVSHPYYWAGFQLIGQWR